MTTIAATATSHYAAATWCSPPSGPALTHGFQVAFYALAGAALVGAAIAALFVESKRRRAEGGALEARRGRAGAGSLTHPERPQTHDREGPSQRDLAVRLLSPGPCPFVVQAMRPNTTDQGGSTMNTRIESPGLTVPAPCRLYRHSRTAARQSDVPETTLYLVELRASQINGCSICVDMHSRELKCRGETAARINTVAAWRETPELDPARLPSWRPCTDRGCHSAWRIGADTWSPTTSGTRRHVTTTRAQLAALSMAIATINAFNRINAATRQITGDWAAPVARHAGEGRSRGLTAGRQRIGWLGERRPGAARRATTAGDVSLSATP